MRIALINENSQLKKNAFILKVLNKVALEFGHTVFNYGVSEEKKSDINYVGAGLLTGILLNAHVVDFVITGCSSGEGVLITSNSLPNVTCGYIGDFIDATLFARINAGNAVSIPFGKYFGTGAELNLEQIFRTLFQTPFACGYPYERKKIQDMQREQLSQIQSISKRRMIDILEEVDKDFLNQIIHNEYFEENFFAYCEDDELSEFLKNIIDA